MVKISSFLNRQAAGRPSQLPLWPQPSELARRDALVSLKDADKQRSTVESYVAGDLLHCFIAREQERF